MNCDTEAIVHRCKALANPIRLRFLSLLRRGELCLCQVKAVTGLPNSTVSEQLAYLRKAGLVMERREGRWVFFRINTEPEIQKILKTVWPYLEGNRVMRLDAESLADHPRRVLGMDRLKPVSRAARQPHP